MNYKKLFLREKIKIYEKERNGLKPNSVTIKHAINYTATAWGNVTSQTIVNCWKNTAILPDVNNNSNEIEHTLSLLNEENGLQSLIDQLELSNPLSASEYTTIDETEKIRDPPNEEEIISIIIPNEQDQEQDEDRIGEEALPPPISNIEALLAVEQLKLYIEQSDNLQLNNDELKLLKNLKRRIKLIEFNSSKQTNLDSFLNI